MCDAIESTFQPLATLAKALGVMCTNDQPFRALGLSAVDFLPGTLSDLHIILWKFVIIHMVAVDEEGRKLEPREVWKAAVRRQRSRLEAHAGKVQLRINRQGAATPSQLDSWAAAQVQPLADGYDEHGSQLSSNPWAQTLHALDLNTIVIVGIHTVNRTRPAVSPIRVAVVGKGDVSPP